MTSRPEIIVKAHIDNGSVLFPEHGQRPFKSIADAAAYMRDQFKDAPIEYVMEIERDANGISRGHDRSEDFAHEWMRLEWDELEDQYYAQLRSDRERKNIHEMRARAEGPIFVPSAISHTIAAE